MVFYFSATGNSLYVARNLDADTYSIPKEMKKNERRYKADRIGIVCPLFEFEVPDYVKDFIRSSDFDTEYFIWSSPMALKSTLGLTLFEENLK